MTIYVGNLSYDVTETDLTQVFGEYGSVTDVQIPIDRETQRKRGFGFIKMATDDEETKAIGELDSAEWMGRVLKVNKARPREDRKPSDHSGRGWGNNRNSSRSY